MSVDKQKIITRIVKRLSDFYSTDFTQDLKNDYLELLNRKLPDVIKESQISLIQEAIANFPIKINSADNFLKLITPIKKDAALFTNGERGDGKDWARRIVIRSKAGEKPTSISLKWAKEVLEKTGELEKSIV